ncbi:MAG: histidinol-phosphate transaminase [Flammeovirgaceae bacterium]|nr:histidinol-phosphate transaminase [Flammeovirgaceae bacterium]
MKIKLPENIASVESYKPGKSINNVFEGLNLERTAILSSNENNFGPSPKALEAMKKAMDRVNLYPEPRSVSLRIKLAKRLNTLPENLIIGNGSDGILSTIFKAFFSPGDELISSKGSFVAVNVMTKLNNIPYIQAEMLDGYKFDLDAIAEKINSKTKAIYLCNPNNPTGTIINQKTLDGFVKKVPENILIIVDEAYSEFANSLTDDFPDSTKYNFPNLITLRTFSKAYGLAGVRLGYGIAHEEIVSTLLKVKLTFDPSIVAQEAGVGALDDEEFLQKTISNNLRGMSFYKEKFEEMGLKFIPSFGNFVMVDFGTEEIAGKVFEELLKRGVFVRPLKFFQLPHCLRISIGTPNECELLAEKLEEVIKLLKS